MKKHINLDNYDRKEQFKFFKDFEEPFFGLTTHLNCENIYNYCKKKKIPFFAYYLYQTNKAVNQVNNFRQRIINDQIYQFDVIHISTTIARKNKTFGFSYLKHSEHFNEFLDQFVKERKRIENSDLLMPANMDEQVIHYSAIPWINFSSISHARKFSINDTCPKITFGKIHKSKEGLMMPVSIHAHHALVDGYHVGQLVQIIQNNFNNNE